MNRWELPVRTELGGRSYGHKSDFRDMLKLIALLNDERRPAMLRWYTAVAYFYEAEIPDSLLGQAMDYLSDFLSCGQRGRPGPKLFDWEQDAQVIVADINKAAGLEIRALPFLHWWTFLAYFHAIGEGQLSTVVAIREKLRRGKKLEAWEQEYYRKNRERIDMKKRYSPEELAEQERLKQLLGE